MAAFDNQISNRNFLSPIGFKFNLTKIPKVDMFCNYARLPEISLGTAIQTTFLKDIELPGDKLTYGDLNLRFLIDENLENYLAVHNWMRGLGTPESNQEYADLLTNEEGVKEEQLERSDGTLHILNSNYNTVAIVNFRDLFPVSLTSMDFEADDDATNYLTAEVTFKYTIYDITMPAV